MFDPKAYLESSVVPPGTYPVRLRGFQVGPSGKLRLRFEVAGQAEKEVMDWIDPENDPALRRVCQAAKLLFPDLLGKKYPDRFSFISDVCAAWEKSGKFLQAVIVTVQSQDGTPVSRIRTFLGVAEVGEKVTPKKKEEEVPF